MGDIANVGSMVRPCELVADVQGNAAADVHDDVASGVCCCDDVSGSAVHFENSVSAISEITNEGKTWLRQSFHLIVKPEPASAQHSEFSRFRLHTR